MKTDLSNTNRKTMSSHKIMDGEQPPTRVWVSILKEGVKFGSRAGCKTAKVTYEEGFMIE